MQITKRLIFSFLYVRRGQTNMWLAEKGEKFEVPVDAPWEGPGLRQKPPDGKREWVDVAVELGADDDLEEVCSDALERADADFSRRHPNSVLVTE